MKAYRTTDVALAAFLVVQGHALVSITRSRRDGRLRFKFDSNLRLDHDIQDYCAGDDFVPAQAYLSTVSQLEEALMPERRKMQCPAI